MAPRKKQKVTKAETEPLGAARGRDGGPTEEELQLSSALFGSAAKQHAPSGQTRGSGLAQLGSDLNTLQTYGDESGDGGSDMDDVADDQVSEGGLYWQARHKALRPDLPFCLPSSSLWMLASRAIVIRRYKVSGAITVAQRHLMTKRLHHRLLLAMQVVHPKQPLLRLRKIPVQLLGRLDPSPSGQTHHWPPYWSLWWDLKLEHQTDPLLAQNAYASCGSARTSSLSAVKSTRSAYVRCTSVCILALLGRAA